MTEQPLWAAIASMVLEYLKVLLAWPMVALVLGVYALTALRAPLGEWLRTLSIKMKAGDKEFEATPAFEQAVARKPADPMASAAGANVSADDRSKAVELSAAATAGATATVALDTSPHVTRELPEELRSDPQAIKQLEYVKNNPGAVVGEYRQVYFAAQAERMFNLIYLSQIQLLIYLRTVEKAMPLSFITPIYEKHVTRVTEMAAEKKTFPNPASIEAWLEFLVSWGAIVREGTPPYSYRITEFGSAFLDYIQREYPVAWVAKSW